MSFFFFFLSANIISVSKNAPNSVSSCTLKCVHFLSDAQMRWYFLLHKKRLKQTDKNDGFIFVDLASGLSWLHGEKKKYIFSLAYKCVAYPRYIKYILTVDYYSTKIIVQYEYFQVNIYRYMAGLFFFKNIETLAKVIRFATV